MAYTLYLYPWNLISGNRDQTASALSSLGFHGINLAVSCQAEKFIHPCGNTQRVDCAEEGAVYFKPRLHYGRIKPRVSRLLEQCDVTASLAGRTDLTLNAWVVLFHNTQLGMDYPDATVKNAFGDSYVYSLCPSHPDVQQYGITLCKDIAQHYSVAQLLLETPGFLTYNRGFHHEPCQVAPNPWLDTWLGLCFCEHCISGAKRAGIDARSLQRYAADEIDKFLRTDSTPDVEMASAWLQADLVTNADLAAFVNWRCQLVTTLVGRIREAVDPATRIKIIATTQKPHATAIWEGHDLAALNKAADGLELPLFQSTTEASVADAVDVIRRVGGVDSLGAILRPGWPDMHSESGVSDTISCLRDLGFDDIAFYNYGLLPPVNPRGLQAAIAGQPCNHSEEASEEALIANRLLLQCTV